MSENDAYTNYGIYEISDSFEVAVPNNEIQFRKLSENVFSYTRKGSDGKTIEKMIPIKSKDLTIEMAPIRPLNYPAKRTSYVYLDFESPVFLSENFSTAFFALCPIEIGLFLIHDNHKDSLDFFSCDPLNSRFGLYGTPESGTLCKYLKSEIVESYDHSTPFMNAVVRIEMQNELHDGHSISRVIFPITQHSLYYKEEKAILDSVVASLKKKLTIESLDVSAKKLSTDWTESPVYERAEVVKRLDVGVD